MPGTTEVHSVHVHIIDPDGNDHYPVFINLTKALEFVEAMRKLKICAEII